ncbi:hypothetical protein FCULG_00009258 [Fusarium culmorum]|uniref:Peptidase S8/S53 domain-containing protein n=1 Tax=Fusarium culmorum TaxID=5516 RepID=A0A2T4GHS1_FUSCU|nr:hypothetical protein FCULG_00009258 [Fusarium culmorum]
MECPVVEVEHASYNNGRDQRLANDIGIAYLSDQDKSASKLDTEDEVERFECFQNAEVTGGSLDQIKTQTRISHENNPLGRLFVTLENVSLTGNNKAGQETHDIKVHFGFDERRVTLVTDARCFASYLTVAQGKIYEKFMRGPLYGERVIYYREIYTPEVRYCVKSLGRVENCTPSDLSSQKYHALYMLRMYDIHYSGSWKASIANQRIVNSKVCDVEKLDLLQSTIWIYDHDRNGNPYTSKTDWKTLIGQSLVKSTEAATFVKSPYSGHERTDNDWLEELDKLFKVMKSDRNDSYGKVKIAVIDSGLNDTVKRRYMTQNNIVYKDFSHETWNDSWHGTCCAKIIGDMYEEAKLFIARIFEEDHANDIEGPIRMAKAIDWAMSNSVDIISISAGFRDYSKELDEAVTRAKAAGTLVVAAAANWQNTGTIAFPARHNLTTMCIYSTNVGNQSSSFNPEPRSDTPNFAVLGEGFQHPDQKSEPMSGTSSE